MENYINMLERENDELKSVVNEYEDGLLNDKLLERDTEVKELKTIIEELHEQKHDKNIRVIEELREQVKDLRIDLVQAIKLRDKFGTERDDNRKNMDILKAEVKRGEEQYRTMSSFKEYQQEAEEYFHHNPQSKGIRFHMIDFSEYDNDCVGEYSGTLYAEDCMLEIDNNN